MKKPVSHSRSRLPASVLAGAVLLCAATSADDFLEQRREFRKEIENKVEQELSPEGNYLSVIFQDEVKKYDFRITPRDGNRLQSHLGSFFACDDRALLARMVEDLDRGRYIIYKEYHDDGVLLKVVFLVPEAKYWEWLTDANGIEKMFHVYNFSVGLYQPDPDSRSVILQTEGAFFGITQAVNLPIIFYRDLKQRTSLCRMPTQDEMMTHLRKMPAIKPGRDQPEEKFIDACRTHPYFQQVDPSGVFKVSDEDILELYRTVVTNKDEDCPIRDISGGWRVHEDYPYLVVDYSLKTTVNVEAIIPRSMRFLAGATAPVVQRISDEVSVKYLPLSMKNFRDHAQQWTRHGAPE
ncbi:MAG TPA: hypothetical protein VM658_04510 [bacterium]|nr:hypothetical protein [bacterium]